MSNMVAYRLSPNQAEPWTFRIEPDSEGGGIVSVPNLQQGYPIDWPPRIPAQEAWLRTFAPRMEARAGSAWHLKQADLERLIETLESHSRPGAPP